MLNKHVFTSVYLGHYDARCVIHLPRCTVAGLHVCWGWWERRRPAHWRQSSADGLLVAWLLWPSGPLSSDCHSWGLRYRFLRRSHSSKLTSPTKHCLPRPTSHRCHLSWQMERQRFETNLYLLPLIPPFFCLPWLIHQSFSSSLTHPVSLSSPLSCPAFFFFQFPDLPI